MTPDLLVNLRAYLVAEDLVRIPREPLPAGRPPLWLEPRDGVPAPGEGKKAVEIDEDLVLGADRGVGLTPKPYEAWLRDDMVDVTFRAREAWLTVALEEELRARLVDRRDWQMAGLHVIESQLWRPLAPIKRNDQAFTHRCSFHFQLYA